MTADTTFKAVLDVIRREWWIVALTAVAAAAIGFVASSGVEPQYSAKATVIVDYGTISRLRGLPYPDDVARDSATAELRERFAKAAGLTVSEIGAGIRVVTQGSPPTRMAVTFRSADKATAEKAAAAIATEISAYVKELASGEVEHQQTIIDAAERALGEMDAARKKAPNDAWRGAEHSFERWQVEKDLADARNALRVAEGVYSFDGDVVVSAQSVSSTRQRNALGALLVGLALGCVVAAAREVVMRGRAAKA